MLVNALIFDEVSTWPKDCHISKHQRIRYHDHHRRQKARGEIASGVALSRTLNVRSMVAVLSPEHRPGWLAPRQRSPGVIILPPHLLPVSSQPHQSEFVWHASLTLPETSPDTPPFLLGGGGGGVPFPLAPVCPSTCPCPCPAPCPCPCPCPCAKCAFAPFTILAAPTLPSASIADWFLLIIPNPDLAPEVPIFSPPITIRVARSGLAPPPPAPPGEVGPGERGGVGVPRDMGGGRVRPPPPPPAEADCGGEGNVAATY
jgi:hypothetical protein